MEDYKKIEAEAKENYSNYKIEEEDPWHHEVEKIIRKRVLKILSRYATANSIVLNAGSGGEDYPCKGKLIHLDITDANIKQFPNYLVASITDIPLEDSSVDIIVCVGSVINYTDAETAIKEFSRVLKPNGILVLEFERSNSADFLFDKRHHQDKFEIVYDYNNQKHKMIMYGEKYITNHLKNNSFEFRRKHRYHVASMLANKIGIGDSLDYKFVHLDFLLWPFSYFLAHNIIIKCKKSAFSKTIN